MKSTLMLLVCLSVHSMATSIPLSEAEKEFKKEVTQLILDNELIIEREVPVARSNRESRMPRVSRIVRDIRPMRLARPQREVSFRHASNIKSEKIKITLSLIK